MLRAALRRILFGRSAGWRLGGGIFLGGLIGLVGSAEASDWWQFRGARQDGIGTETGMPIAWSESGNEIRWRTPIVGLGWSTPAIRDGLAWVTTADRETGSLRLIAIELEAGEIVRDVEVFRKESLGPIHQKNSHASPSPIVTASEVFVHFGAHGTACVELDGTIRWSRVEDYGHHHGPGGSPVLFEGTLILTCDGNREQFVEALDIRTGKSVWRTKREHFLPSRTDGTDMPAIGFSTPLIVSTEAGPQLIAVAADHVSGFDPRTGRELWWSTYEGYSNVPMPVVWRDQVFVATGYTAPQLHAIRIGGSGDVTDTHRVWTLERGAPANPTPTLVGDDLYVLNDSGVLMCLSAETGERRWQERIGGNFSASPLLVDGLLYLQDENGRTTIVRPGPSYDEVAVNELDGRTLATPVPVEGGLLIRTDKELLRIDGASER
ncbi:MAG TPA: PQQ-binding-like beta-propeller repeat protein [Pirellulaceae bacterium]|nr:PQQ-binding-like beta-propeller repeat protein [Pirellulaceae bacterium]